MAEGGVYGRDVKTVAKQANNTHGRSNMGASRGASEVLGPGPNKYNSMRKNTPGS